MRGTRRERAFGCPQPGSEFPVGMWSEWRRTRGSEERCMWAGSAGGERPAALTQPHTLRHQHPYLYGKVPLTHRNPAPFHTDRAKSAGRIAKGTGDQRRAIRQSARRSEERPREERQTIRGAPSRGAPGDQRPAAVAPTAYRVAPRPTSVWKSPAETPKPGTFPYRYRERCRVTAEAFTGKGAGLSWPGLAP